MANLETIGPDVLSQPLNNNFAALNDDIVNVPHALYRNAIINGNFDIWQRGTNFTSPGYTADRWRANFGAGGSVTQQQFTLGQTDVPGEPRFFIRLIGKNPGANLLVQHIEDVRTLAGQTITISFWAKSSAPVSNIIVRLRQEFGSGGSSVVQIPGPNLSTTTNWQRYTATITIPSIAGKTLGTNHSLAFEIRKDNDDFTLDIAQVQICAGSVALPFQPRPLAVEEMLCRRYFERITNQNFLYIVGFEDALNSTFISTNVMFKVPKRATPTITISGGFYYRRSGSVHTVDNTGVTFVGVGREGFSLEYDLTKSGLTANPNAAAGFRFGSSNSYIDVDAEF
jgi:hypothetical protein